MTERTTESFRQKLMRMFLPVNPKTYGKVNPQKKDLDIIDPFERFEKSILEDSEKKSKARRNSTKEEL